MSGLTIEGRVAWIFPDHFDVDQIVGVENIHTSDLDILRSACLADFEPDFADQVREGDVLVAGRNFGYGHPHDQAMIVMRSLGVSCVIAESFGLMFSRSWEFLGVPLLRCPGIVGEVKRWDNISVRWEDAQVYIERTGRTVRGIQPSENAIALVHAGGGANLLWERRELSSLSRVDMGA
jgi:3-isopropylmalate/(R)-2-methylmalate dehydratase small subunit